MISLNDVLLAMSNIPVDDPIAEIWGRGLQGGYKIIKYTGTLPITITANGDALIDYRIYGADGGVGVATENLFDVTKETKGAFLDYLGRINSASNAAYSDLIVVEQTTYYVCDSSKRYDLGSWTLRVHGYDGNGNWVKQITATTSFTPEGYHSLAITIDDTEIKKIRISYFYAFVDWLTFSKQEISTYIPYGYKLPMTIGDGNTAQTVPVYIGENQLDSVEGVSDYVDKSSGKIVRMIGEYTFTGDEAFTTYNNYGVCCTKNYISPRAKTPNRTITMRCDHPTFTAITNRWIGEWTPASPENDVCNFRTGSSEVFFRSTANFMTAEECKAYLKTQYDNGTPVKISYWLKTPVEEEPPVPLPEIPTIEGTTVIDYDGNPKPPQMYVKYKGKSGDA